MFIKTATHKFHLNIDMHLTIHRLKQELEVVEGIPPSEQRIIFSGKQLLDGNKTLSEYGLTTQDQTLLVLRQTNASRSITIFVRTIQRELDFKLTVSLSDKIETIRGTINDRVNLPSSYSLVHKGIVLDDQQTVLDYGIQDRSSIYIVTQIVMEVDNVNGERVKMKIKDDRITGEVVERLVEQRRAHKKQKKRKAEGDCTTTEGEEKGREIFPSLSKAVKRNRTDAADCVPAVPTVTATEESHGDSEEQSDTTAPPPPSTFLEIRDLDLSQTRCHKCSKKIGLTGIQCRCNDHFCGAHRYPEEHHCPFDYRTKAREELAKANPRVTATKVIPIAK